MSSLYRRSGGIFCHQISKSMLRVSKPDIYIHYSALAVSIVPLYFGSIYEALARPSWRDGRQEMNFSHFSIMYSIENQLRKTEDAMWDSERSVRITLANKYRVNPGYSDDLSYLFDFLEGQDAIVRSVCEDLGLGICINAVLHDCRSSEFWQESWIGGLALLDRTINISDPLDLDTNLLQHTRLIHPHDGGPCYGSSRYGERSKAIAWIRPLKNGRTGYDLDGVSFEGVPVEEHVEGLIILDMIEHTIMIKRMDMNDFRLPGDDHGLHVDIHSQAI
ncbi:hypothetical protein L218DRAFT_949219 [Marasmius fiardii PR-910]|nr:hypothetical protein L218DRAFT_949219 [Marasmius fiardii PR-910]